MRQSWRVLNLDLGLEEDEASLRPKVAEQLGVATQQILGLRVARRSVDARRRRGNRTLRFVLHVDVEVNSEQLGATFAKAQRRGRVVEVPTEEPFEISNLPPDTGRAPTIVVGAGPAGLYAAYVLALNGRRTRIIDRGRPLEERGRDVVRFHRTRQPNQESNLLFGEGGAGTYSDGKLYTRVKDSLEGACLDLLIDAGAQPEIRFDSRAHIGTDRLHRVIPKLREKMIDLGVEFCWQTRLEGLNRAPDGSIRSIRTSAGQMDCDALFLAPGHSARDTIEQLHRDGVAVESKPFQLGVRIEHPQRLINAGRYGLSPEAAKLGAAYYNLVCQPKDGSVGSYSFCMCPGGKIVASVNEEGLLCTNGMSNSMHSSPWANAAIVTTFGPDDFGSDPFDGVRFQREIESRFFVSGGGDYSAPAQAANDFLARRASRKLRRTSYTFGHRSMRIDELLPTRARDAIGRALEKFERQLPGFASAEGVLVGVESRSSGPIRLPRDRESYRAIGVANLLPIGEGAGYAGGIMSAALDGARAAKRWLES
jgi:uncharacterized FAD-dependent dehydrogenase